MIYTKITQLIVLCLSGTFTLLLQKYLNIPPSCIYIFFFFFLFEATEILDKRSSYRLLYPEI